MLWMLQQVIRVRRVQKRLRSALAAEGVDFMRIRPDLHAQLLRDALQGADPAELAYRFARTAGQVGQLAHLDSQQKQAFLAVQMAAGGIAPPLAGAQGHGAAAQGQAVDIVRKPQAETAESR